LASSTVACSSCASNAVSTTMTWPSQVPISQRWDPKPLVLDLARHVYCGSSREPGIDPQWQTSGSALWGPLASGTVAGVLQPLVVVPLP
jgi:hypothetical protein